MALKQPLQLEHIFASSDSTWSHRKNSIRQAALHFAKTLAANSPVSQDQETAIQHIRQAVMFAEAAIDTDGMIRTWDLIKKNIIEKILRPIESHDTLVKCVYLNPKTFVFLSRSYPENWHPKDSTFLQAITMKDLLLEGKVGYFNHHTLIRVDKLIPENHFLAFGEDEEIPEDLSQLESQKLFDYYS